jgi:hypothetical protein
MGQRCDEGAGGGGKTLSEQFQQIGTNWKKKICHFLKIESIYYSIPKHS